MNRFFFFRKFQRLTSFTFQDPFFLHQCRLKKKTQGIPNTGNFRLWFFGFKLYLRNRYNTLSHSVLKKYKLFQGKSSRTKQKRKIKIKLTKKIKLKIRSHIKRAFKHKYKQIFIPKPSKFSFRKKRKDLLNKVLRTRSRMFRHRRKGFPLMATLRIRKLKLLRKLAIRPQAKILSVMRKRPRKMKIRGNLIKTTIRRLRGIKWITNISKLWKDKWTDTFFPYYANITESRVTLKRMWDIIRPFNAPESLRLAEKRKINRYRKTRRILRNWRTSSTRNLRRFNMRFKTSSYRYKKFSAYKTFRLPRKRIKKKVYIRRLFSRIYNNFIRNKTNTNRKLPNIFWKNYRWNLALLAQLYGFYLAAPKKNWINNDTLKNWINDDTFHSTPVNSINKDTLKNNSISAYSINRDNRDKNSTPVNFINKGKNYPSANFVNKEKNYPNTNFVNRDNRDKNSTPVNFVNKEKNYPSANFVNKDKKSTPVNLRNKDKNYPSAYSINRDNRDKNSTPVNSNQKEIYEKYSIINHLKSKDFKRFLFKELAKDNIKKQEAFNTYSIYMDILVRETPRKRVLLSSPYWDLIKQMRETIKLDRDAVNKWDAVNIDSVKKFRDVVNKMKDTLIINLSKNEIKKKNEK